MAATGAVTVLTEPEVVPSRSQTFRRRTLAVGGTTSTYGSHSRFVPSGVSADAARLVPVLVPAVLVPVLVPVLPEVRVMVLALVPVLVVVVPVMVVRFRVALSGGE